MKRIEEYEDNGNLYRRIWTDDQTASSPELIGPVEPEVKVTVEPPQELSSQPEAASQEEAPENCQAKTKAGNPCQNKAKEGSDYCGVHQ